MCFAEKLKKLDVSIVRVFSEVLVLRQYPIPGVTQGRKYRSSLENEVLEEHKDVALHELIRQPDRQHAEEIREYDSFFKSKPAEVTKKMLTDYRILITKASQLELQKAQVILCTCGVSGGPLFKSDSDANSKNKKKRIRQVDYL